ncbi:hypothetical protein [Halochromatium glycolicum]|uniref:Uncharacterized protein n=1 Tax=Halochromatium glycolicum TaxID=85075 RepID=A0AAJ0UBC7_9GAMM|nr:hypothetical protein [Halochromatium glycolicum]MBK1707322.1 hypothetical protein [Halochromatium glycolicum]
MAQQPRLSIAGPALRGLTALAVLVLTAPYWGFAYLALVLPIYEWILNLLPHGWDSVTVSLVVDGRETMVKASFRTFTGFEFAGSPIPSLGSVSSFTLQGHVLQHPVTILTLWAAWPLRHWTLRLVALPLIIPGLAVVEATDVPLVLYGSMQDLLLANLAPDRLASDPFVTAMDVMNSGGRIALGAAAGIAAMALTGAITGPAPETPAHGTSTDVASPVAPR